MKKDIEFVARTLASMSHTILNRSDMFAFFSCCDGCFVVCTRNKYLKADEESRLCKIVEIAIYEHGLWRSLVDKLCIGDYTIVNVFMRN